MIYLSGVVHPELVGLRPDVGFIITPRMGNQVDLSETPWGGDNGCFADGGSFDEGAFLDFLQHRYRPTCLFAVAPDVLADAMATWERSRPVLPRIRKAGYLAAYVAQDGATRQTMPWGAFDVVFIGGTTKWKLSHHAREITDEAKHRGKWVHMGRVNSERRLRTAKMWGCDSADGTFLKVAPDHNIPRMMAWLDSIAIAPPLVYGGRP